MFNYSVFILRCWQDGSTTRFRLENPRTGESHMFQEFEELEQFVERFLNEAEAHTRSNDGEINHDTQ
ncbi:MAG: hypothetical protein AAF902_16480 [Chloroflexota bacterium]